MIYQMTYVSRCTFPIEKGGARTQLDEILSKSQPNNERDGLTGFLVFDPPWFVQVLEGAHGEVVETLRRIERDARHCGLLVIGAREIRNRSFPTWSMNGALRTPETDAIYLRHGFSHGLEPSQAQPAQVLMLALDLQNHQDVADAQARLAG